MNRLQFLKMMRDSLIETMKEASAPLLEDEVEKVKKLFSNHRTWHAIGPCDDICDVEIKTVDRIPLVVYKHEGTLYVRKAICSHCQVMPHYIQQDHRFICLYCDREWHVFSQKGTLHMPLLPTKREGDEWYVQIERDSYA
ncbi:nitrite reductase/ring-hydroxylating ferredoxin subunit [Anoxybacillus kamchatkensis]|uniref:2Fe-2S ferredoxin n=1 Tax=Anoxybacillus ayderensis TaxID=265546 RepID=UPI0015EB517B|nr:2Fe-2S ferredoxin [Anoxybacillus ayderensis]MBA2878091.1 nitrite reductase/ring-hydroxylating ferredoxin subunit [Anoxybacillus ayderensis]